MGRRTLASSNLSKAVGCAKLLSVMQEVDSGPESRARHPLREVHIDSCSWTRWRDSSRRDVVKERMRRDGVHLYMMLDVMLETLQPMDTEHRSQHLALLRGLPGNGVPGAGDLLRAVAVGLDCSDLVDLATTVVSDAVAHLRIDEEIVRQHGVHAKRGKASLIDADSQSREHYSALRITKDATFQEAALAASRDRPLLRTCHAALLCGEVRKRGLGRIWLRNPSARCWGLGWLWRARVGSIQSAKRAPGHDDLAQLVMLPHCDAFVTDDRRLANAARDVLAIARTGRPRDLWKRPSPHVFGFEEFATALLSQ